MKISYIFISILLFVLGIFLWWFFLWNDFNISQGGEARIETVGIKDEENIESAEVNSADTLSGNSGDIPEQAMEEVSTTEPLKKIITKNMRSKLNE